MKITVGYTARNEADLIGKTLTDAVQELKAQGNSYEILVVDNASTDDTARIADEFAANHEFIRVIRHPSNLGYAHSNWTVYKNASGDLVATVDSDGQLTLRDLPKFYAKIQAGADIVYGWRKPRRDPAFRKIITAGLNWSAKQMLRWNLHDINCGFRVVTPAVAKSFTSVHPVNYFGPEVWVHSVRNGFKVDEVIVEHFERMGGTSIHIPWRMPITIRNAYRHLADLRKELPAV